MLAKAYWGITLTPLTPSEGKIVNDVSRVFLNAPSPRLKVREALYSKPVNDLQFSKAYAPTVLIVPKISEPRVSVPANFSQSLNA